MLKFTNGFSCATDERKGDLIISFLQQAPALEADGSLGNVKVEEVITLVMGKETAATLKETLNEMLSSANEDN